MVPLRVAFAGERATGKSTLADHLVSVFEFEKRSLAQPIKRIIAEAPSTTHDRHAYLWEWAERLYPNDLARQAKFASRAGSILATERDPGRLAQQIGSVGRDLDDQVWTRYLLERLPGGDCTVDDVRYANEVDALRANGFCIVRLDAPESVLAERIARRGDDHRDPSHASEHSLPAGPYHAVWWTDEPLEATLSRLDRLVERLSRGEEIPWERMRG